MKRINPINLTGEVSRTICAHYMKAGGQDLDPASPNPHTAILEIEFMEKQVAQVYDKEKNPMNGCVYSKDGISPTLRTPTGGMSEPKIILTQPISCAIRGRNPENPSDRRAGIPTVQRLELSGDVANCLPHVQKDSMVAEPCILGYTRDDKGNVQSYHEKNIANTLHTSTGSGSNTDQFVKEPSTRKDNIRFKLMPNGNIRAYDDSTTDKRGVSELQIVNPDNECPTVTTAHAPKVLMRYRIRKLTERECFRLMGMDDADIDRIDAYRIKTTLKNGTVKEKPISKSQKYKMAGNSIVVDVLYHIFYQMFIAETPKQKLKQLTLFNL